MSAEQFERIAQEAEDLARKTAEVSTYLRRVGDTAVSVIGGTSTGADQAMLGITQEAMTKIRAASAHLARAARSAREAVAIEAERDRRERRRAGGG